MNDDAARDELTDEDALATLPEPALYWTACFLVSQCLGGPEEGSWWFDRGELVTTVGLPINVSCFAHKHVVQRKRQKSVLFARLSC